MSKRNVLIYTNVGKSQIEETDTHFKIIGIPITKNNDVMNRVAYLEQHNADGMPTMVDQPITLRHPEVDGVNVSAKQGKGLTYFSGSLIEQQPYLINGTWKVDTLVNKKKLAAQDDGERWTEILSNKETFGVSTGLTFARNNESGEINGKEYDMVAKNQSYDHLAFLDPKVEAPAGGENTMVRFNSNVEQGEIIVCNITDDEQQESLTESAFNKLVEKLKGVFAPATDKGYNSQEFDNQDEDYAMRKTIEAKLQAAGIEVNGLDDNALLEAYNKLNAPQEPKQKPQTNSDDTPAWAKDLVAKVNSLETQLTANADKELNEVAEQVAALNKGLDADDAKALGLEKAKAFLAANGAEHVAEGYNAQHGGRTTASNKKDDEFDSIDLNAGLEG